LYGGLQHRDLVLQWLQGLHLDLDGVQATKDGVEHGFNGGGCAGGGL
jgi:hypothetical protein